MVKFPPGHAPNGMKPAYRQMIRALAGAAPGGALAEWGVYLLRCADGSLYTGIAKDIARRLAAHNAGRGAAYTRARRPAVLVYARRGFTRSEALIEEARIKTLSRAQKELLLAPPAETAAGGEKGSPFILYFPPSRLGGETPEENMADKKPTSTAVFKTFADAGWKKKDIFFSSLLPQGFSATPFALNSFSGCGPGGPLEVVEDAGVDTRGMAPLPLACPSEEPGVAVLFVDLKDADLPVYFFHEELHRVSKNLKDFMASLGRQAAHAPQGKKLKTPAGETPVNASGQSYTQALLSGEHAGMVKAGLAAAAGAGAGGGWGLLSFGVLRGARGTSAFQPGNGNIHGFNFNDGKSLSKTWPRGAYAGAAPGTLSKKAVLIGDLLKGQKSYLFVSAFLKNLLVPLLGSDAEFLPVELRDEAEKKVLAADFYMMKPLRALQAMEVMDLEASEAEVDRENDWVDDFQKLVLREGKIPKDVRLFVLDGVNGHKLFVSPSVGDALLKAGIAGLRVRNPQTLSAFDCD